MEDDWQKIADEDVKPVVPRPVPVAAANRWDGEDEDDDIKDSWDADDDDEKKDEEKAPVQPSKPKKTLAQKIEEKERLKKEKEEKRRKELEEESMANMTPEERAAEKLRLKKIQEEADLKIGLESLGLTPSKTPAASGLESFNPSTKEEFIEYAEAVSKTVSQFKSKAEYVTFVDELVRSLCAGLPSVSIRKVKTSVDNIYLEKQKLEKGDKPKKKTAAKVKATLKMEGDDDYNSRVGAFEADDYDDFM